MRSRFISLTLAAIFVLTFSASIKAETFTAYLTGAQEVPPAATSATGFARFFVNEAAGTCSFQVVYNNLSSIQNGAHIHAPAAIGATVGVAIDFGVVGGTSGEITGNCTITPTQLSQIRQHLGYVNVHSVNFPNGEIRGQLGILRPVDYDGDGRQDLSVLRFPAAGDPLPLTYLNSNSTTGESIIPFGGDANTDFPVPGDYDGDAKGDLAIYRAGADANALSYFVIFRSATNTWFVQGYGQGSDTAHNRDYDGDGRTDLAVVRPGALSTDPLQWWIRRSSTPTNDYVVLWGRTGGGVTDFDTPVSGDYDGDGKFDVAVYRFGASPFTNSFLILRSSDAALQVQPWGNFNSDYILPGDYDGDGRFDFCAGRTGATAGAQMTWFIRHADGSTRTIPWGRSSDRPVQGDYDGDARTDVAVYRPGATAGASSTFWIYRSFTNSPLGMTWGLGSDFPVATFDAR